MITVYDIKTGEPTTLEPIDARERIAVGLALSVKPVFEQPAIEPKQTKAK